MMTRRGKPDYRLPDDFGQLAAASLDVGTAVHCLMLLEPEQMLKQRKRQGDVLGVPVFVAVGDEYMWLCPCPDAAYPLLARYQPKMKTF
jgi:hypothetical protein